MELFNTILNHRLWHKHAQTGALALSILLLVGVIGMSIWTAYAQNNIKKLNYQATEVSAPSRNSQNAYRVQDIVAANLFGNPSPVVKVEKAPKTTLNLTLQGILSASDSNLARAIIQTGKSSSELYSVGEKIKGAGASVKEIRTHEVLLDRNGAVESLPLLKKSGQNNSIISYSEQAEPGNQNLAIAALNSASSNSSSANSGSQSNASSRQVSGNSRPRAENGAPRKIRKPNFSGLDRALQKMGEL